jgi:hypothetical protein
MKLTYATWNTLAGGIDAGDGSGSVGRPASAHSRWNRVDSHRSAGGLSSSLAIVGSRAAMVS